MTVQWSASLRNAVLDAWEAAIGTSAKIQIRTGTAPTNCAAPDSGVLLAEFALGSDWALPAASGVKQLASLPLSTAAIGTGDAGHYRVKDSAGTTCHEQGRVAVTGGGGDLTVDDVSVSAGEPLEITAWGKTAPGA